MVNLNFCKFNIECQETVLVSVRISARKGNWQSKIDLFQ